MVINKRFRKQANLIARYSLPRRATAAVELAFVLPVLMTLVLGVVDFGRIMHDYVVVSNASRVGAQYGATHRFTAYSRSSWESQLRSAITTEMESASAFDPSQLQITLSTAADSYDLVRVTVDVEYPFVPLVNWPGLPQQILLWRRNCMREIQ